jgi:hypothetical protein
MISLKEERNLGGLGIRKRRGYNFEKYNPG